MENRRITDVDSMAPALRSTDAKNSPSTLEVPKESPNAVTTYPSPTTTNATNRKRVKPREIPEETLPKLFAPDVILPTKTKGQLGSNDNNPRKRKPEMDTAAAVLKSPLKNSGTEPKRPRQENCGEMKKQGFDSRNLHETMACSVRLADLYGKKSTKLKCLPNPEKKDVRRDSQLPPGNLRKHKAPSIPETPRDLPTVYSTGKKLRSREESPEVEIIKVVVYGSPERINFDHTKNLKIWRGKESAKVLKETLAKLQNPSNALRDFKIPKINTEKRYSDHKVKERSRSNKVVSSQTKNDQQIPCCSKSLSKADNSNKKQKTVVDEPVADKPLKKKGVSFNEIISNCKIGDTKIQKSEKYNLRNVSSTSQLQIEEQMKDTTTGKELKEKLPVELKTPSLKTTLRKISEDVYELLPCNNEFQLKDPEPIKEKQKGAEHEQQKRKPNTDTSKRDPKTKDLGVRGNTKANKEISHRIDDYPPPVFSQTIPRCQNFVARKKTNMENATTSPYAPKINKGKTKPMEKILKRKETVNGNSVAELIQLQKSLQGSTDFEKTENSNRKGKKRNIRERDDFLEDPNFEDSLPPKFKIKMSKEGELLKTRNTNTVNRQAKLKAETVIKKLQQDEQNGSPESESGIMELDTAVSKDISGNLGGQGMKTENFQRNKKISSSNPISEENPTILIQEFESPGNCGLTKGVMERNYHDSGTNLAMENKKGGSYEEIFFRALDLQRKNINTDHNSGSSEDNEEENGHDSDINYEKATNCENSGANALEYENSTINEETCNNSNFVKNNSISSCKSPESNEDEEIMEENCNDPEGSLENSTEYKILGIQNVEHEIPRVHGMESENANRNKEISCVDPNFEDNSSISDYGSENNENNLQENGANQQSTAINHFEVHTMESGVYNLTQEISCDVSDKNPIMLDHGYESPENNGDILEENYQDSECNLENCETNYNSSEIIEVEQINEFPNLLKISRDTIGNYTEKTEDVNNSNYPRVSLHESDAGEPKDTPIPSSENAASSSKTTISSSENGISKMILAVQGETSNPTVIIPNLGEIDETSFNKMIDHGYEPCPISPGDLVNVTVMTSPQFHPDYFVKKVAFKDEIRNYMGSKENIHDIQDGRNFVEIQDGGNISEVQYDESIGTVQYDANCSELQDGGNISEEIAPGLVIPDEEGQRSEENQGEGNQNSDERNTEEVTAAPGIGSSENNDDLKENMMDQNSFAPQTNPNLWVIPVSALEGALLARSPNVVFLVSSPDQLQNIVQDGLSINVAPWQTSDMIVENNATTPTAENTDKYIQKKPKEFVPETNRNSETPFPPERGEDANEKRLSFEEYTKMQMNPETFSPLKQSKKVDTINNDEKKGGGERKREMEFQNQQQQPQISLFGPVFIATGATDALLHHINPINSRKCGYTVCINRECPDPPCTNADCFKINNKIMGNVISSQDAMAYMDTDYELSQNTGVAAYSEVPHVSPKIGDQVNTSLANDILDLSNMIPGTVVSCKTSLETNLNAEQQGRNNLETSQLNEFTSSDAEPHSNEDNSEHNNCRLEESNDKNTPDVVEISYIDGDFCTWLSNDEINKENVPAFMEKTEAEQTQPNYRNFTNGENDKNLAVIREASGAEQFISPRNAQICSDAEDNDENLSECAEASESEQSQEDGGNLTSEGNDDTNAAEFSEASKVNNSSPNIDTCSKMEDNDELLPDFLEKPETEHRPKDTSTEDENIADFKEAPDAKGIPPNDDICAKGASNNENMSYFFEDISSPEPSPSNVDTCADEENDYEYAADLVEASDAEYQSPPFGGTSTNEENGENTIDFLETSKSAQLVPPEGDIYIYDENSDDLEMPVLDKFSPPDASTTNKENKKINNSKERRYRFKNNSNKANREQKKQSKNKQTSKSRKQYEIAKLKRLSRSFNSKTPTNEKGVGNNSEEMNLTPVPLKRKRGRPRKTEKIPYSLAEAIPKRKIKRHYLPRQLKKILDEDEIQDKTFHAYFQKPSICMSPRHTRSRTNELIQKRQVEDVVYCLLNLKNTFSVENPNEVTLGQINSPEPRNSLNISNQCGTEINDENDVSGAENHDYSNYEETAAVDKVLKDKMAVADHSDVIENGDNEERPYEDNGKPLNSPETEIHYDALENLYCGGEFFEDDQDLELESEEQEKPDENSKLLKGRSREVFGVMIPSEIDVSPVGKEQLERNKRTVELEPPDVSITLQSNGKSYPAKPTLLECIKVRRSEKQGYTAEVPNASETLRSQNSENPVVSTGNKTEEKRQSASKNKSKVLSENLEFLVQIAKNKSYRKILLNTHDEVYHIFAQPRDISRKFCKQPYTETQNLQLGIMPCDCGAEFAVCVEMLESKGFHMGFEIFKNSLGTFPFRFSVINPTVYFDVCRNCVPKTINYCTKPYIGRLLLVKEKPAPSAQMTNTITIEQSRLLNTDDSSQNTNSNSNLLSNDSCNDTLPVPESQPLTNPIQPDFPVQSNFVTDNTRTPEEHQSTGVYIPIDIPPNKAVTTESHSEVVPINKESIGPPPTNRLPRPTKATISTVTIPTLREKRSENNTLTLHYLNHEGALTNGAGHPSVDTPEPINEVPEVSNQNQVPENEQTEILSVKAKCRDQTPINETIHLNVPNLFPGKFNATENLVDHSTPKSVGSPQYDSVQHTPESRNKEIFTGQLDPVTPCTGQLVVQSSLSKDNPITTPATRDVEIGYESLPPVDIFPIPANIFNNPESRNKNRNKSKMLVDGNSFLLESAQFHPTKRLKEKFPLKETTNKANSNFFDLLQPIDGVFNNWVPVSQVASKLRDSIHSKRLSSRIKLISRGTQSIENAKSNSDTVRDNIISATEFILDDEMQAVPSHMSGSGQFSPATVDAEVQVSEKAVGAQLKNTLCLEEACRRRIQKMLSVIRLSKSSTSSGNVKVSGQERPATVNGQNENSKCSNRQQLKINSSRVGGIEDPNLNSRPLDLSTSNPEHIRHPVNKIKDYFRNSDIQINSNLRNAQQLHASGNGETNNRPDLGHNRSEVPVKSSLRSQPGNLLQGSGNSSVPKKRISCNTSTCTSNSNRNNSQSEAQENRHAVALKDLMANVPQIPNLQSRSITVECRPYLATCSSTATGTGESQSTQFQRPIPGYFQGNPNSNHGIPNSIVPASAANSTSWRDHRTVRQRQPSERTLYNENMIGNLPGINQSFTANSTPSSSINHNIGRTNNCGRCGSRGNHPPHQRKPPALPNFTPAIHRELRLMYERCFNRMRLQNVGQEVPTKPLGTQNMMNPVNNNNFPQFQIPPGMTVPMQHTMANGHHNMDTVHPNPTRFQAPQLQTYSFNGVPPNIQQPSVMAPTPCPQQNINPCVHHLWNNNSVGSMMPHNGPPQHFYKSQTPNFQHNGHFFFNQ